MKLGNTSQSMVPVPDFFLTRSLKEMETFHVTNKKKYFREKDLFRLTKDLNLCNNPRNNHRKFEEYNKQKYVPVHKLNLWGQRSSSVLSNHSLTAKVQPDSYDNFKAYMYKTNVSNYTNPDLKEEIKNNIGSLLDRINSNFDVKKWTQYDTRTNFINFHTEQVSDLTLYNMNNESEGTKFRNTLRDKVSSLTVVEGSQKEKALKNFSKIENHEREKKHKYFHTGLENNSDSHLMMSFPSLYNTGMHPNQSQTFEEQKMRSENKHLYDKYQTTNLFKDFPSPTRSEFSIKRGEKVSYKRKKGNDYLIDSNKFNASKHSSVFCESYDTNHGAMKKFVPIKPTFV